MVKPIDIVVTITATERENFESELRNTVRKISWLKLKQFFIISELLTLLLWMITLIIIECIYQ